jgi:hypothetical protein
MITPRENLLKVFRHETPDWLPVFGHVDPYNQPNRDGMDPALAKALGTVQWGDGSTRIFSDYLGLDVMDFFGPPIISKRRKVTVEHVERGDGWTSIYRTPHGELRESHKRVREDGTSYCQEHLVKSGADLALLAEIYEDEEFVLGEGAAEFVRQRKALVGDRGIVRCYMPGTPLGMMVRVYSGVETIAYLWADHREELHRLFTIMEENHLAQFRLAASVGYDVLYGTDDTSTTTISPAMFEEFCLGYTDHVTEAVHAYGTYYAHHSCGHINHLLDLYRQTRMDAVDALCLKPIGDVNSLAEARLKLGPNITILAALTQMGESMDNRPAVAASIATMFRDVAPADHFIFGLAAYPHLNMEQTAFVARECLNNPRRYARRPD